MATGVKMPAVQQDGVSFIVYIATVGGIFSSLWGVIWKIQQNKINKVDKKIDETASGINELSKEERRRLDRIQSDCNTYRKGDRDNFKNIAKEIIEENRKERSSLHLEIERQGNDIKKWFDKFEIYQKEEAQHKEKRAAFEARMEEKTSKMEKDLEFLIKKATG